MNHPGPLTLSFMNKLPPWFIMRHDPQSVGAQFLGVIASEIEETESFFLQSLSNTNLYTADVNQTDYLYRTEISIPFSPHSTMTVSANGEQLVRSLSLYQFLAPPENPLYLSNTYILFDRTIYTKTFPANLVITTIHNGTQYSETLQLTEHHTWNTFDEYGLLLDTPRISGERNARYKQRLLDVFRNRSSSSLTGLINGIARELDISPNTISIHSFHNKKDIVFQNELQTVDNKPTEMLKYYVGRMESQVPIMWGQFIWGEGFWDVSNISNQGSGVIPSFYDQFS